MWFRWFHFSNTRTYGAYDNNKLIGIWGVKPYTFRYKNKGIQVGRAFATGINEKYRRQGLFLKLSNYAFEQEKKRNEVEYLFGFPSYTNVVTGAHLKAGWYPVIKIPIYNLYRESIIQKQKPNNKYYSYVVKEIKPKEGYFITDHKKRIENHPENIYITISSEIDSYIILKPYSSWCHIIDTDGKFSNNIEVAKTILKVHSWDHLTIWCADNELYKDDIIKAGFKKSNKGRTLLAYNVKAKEPIDLSVCHIQNWIEELF